MVYKSPFISHRNPLNFYPHDAAAAAVAVVLIISYACSVIIIRNSPQIFNFLFAISLGIFYFLSRLVMIHALHAQERIPPVWLARKSALRIYTCNLLGK